MRVKCLAQKHNTMTQPGLEPRHLDPESSALTSRLPHLSLIMVYDSKKKTTTKNQTDLKKLKSRKTLNFETGIRSVYLASPI